MLDHCVVSTDAECEDVFEVHDMGKEAYIFKVGCLKGCDWHTQFISDVHIKFNDQNHYKYVVYPCLL